MTEPRKAATSPAEIGLDVYARATVKEDKILREIGEACGTCSGGAACGRPRRAAGVDWPMCPLALVRAPLWRQIVDLYVLAQVSPIEGLPDAWSPVVVDGLVQLKVAARKEDEERAREREARASRGGGAAPQFSGRLSARGPA